MKLNIQKLQSGGGLGMLFSAVADPSSNAAQLAAAQSSSSKKDSSDDGILSKEVLNELRKHGLPNEVDQFELILVQFELRIASGRGISSGQIASLRSMANRIIKQSNYLDTAISTAKENKSLGDIAIDQDGFIYATNKEGKLQKVAFNKFNTEDYNALSYAELAEYRRNSPELINNSDIIKSIQASIGSEKINDFVLSILSKIGLTETKQEAYESLATIRGINPKEISNQELAALKTVAEAANLIGLDSIFKVEEFRKNSNVTLAMSYIMSILPKQMRAQLQGSFIAQGGSYKDSKAYPVSVIQQASLAAADNTYHFGIDYDSSANKAAGTSTSAKEHSTNLKGLEQLINGDLGQVEYPIISKSNPELAITLKGNGMGKLMDAQNKLVNASILSDALDTGLGALIDRNHMYFGEQKLDLYDLDKLVYEGQQVLNVWVPVDANGAPDFGLLKRYEEIRQKAAENKYLSQDDIRLMLAEIGLNGTIDSNGNYVGQDPKMQLFIVLEGLTSDAAFKDIDDNDLSFKISSDKKDATLAGIRKIYANANKGLKGDAVREFPTGWWDWTTKLYAAPVFLKVSKTAQVDAGTIVGNGARVPQLSLEQIMRKDLAGEVYKNTSSML